MKWPELTLERLGLAGLQEPDVFVRGLVDNYRRNHRLLRRIFAPWDTD